MRTRAMGEHERDRQLLIKDYLNKTLDDVAVVGRNRKHNMNFRTLE
jgi:hypothetical protein